MVVRALCAGRLFGIVEFDVGQLGAADDALLRLGGQRIPRCEVVEIFLHDDVAAAGKGRIFGSDQGGIEHFLAPRVLRSVDETQEIAVVEVAEAVDLVDGRDRTADARHDLGREFEAQVHALGANVKHDVARRRDRVARPGSNLPERMQFCRPRIPEEPRPCIGANSHDAGQRTFDVAEFHGAEQGAEVCTERPQGRSIVRSRIDRQHQEDRGAAERCRYGLWNGDVIAPLFGIRHPITFNEPCS